MFGFDITRGGIHHATTKKTKGAASTDATTGQPWVRGTVLLQQRCLQQGDDAGARTKGNHSEQRTTGALNTSCLC